MGKQVEYRYVWVKNLTNEPKDKQGLGTGSPFWGFVQKKKWQKECKHEKEVGMGGCKLIGREQKSKMGVLVPNPTCAFKGAD